MIRVKLTDDSVYNVPDEPSAALEMENESRIRDERIILGRLIAGGTVMVRFSLQLEIMFF